MSKFHINKHGVPAPCRATKGNCPLGGDSGNENHFSTEKEAQEHADKENSEKYGLLNDVNKRSPETVEGFDPELEKRLLSGSSGNRMYAARRGYGAEILAHDDNVKVRMVLADNGYASDTLSKDEDENIRYNVLAKSAHKLSEESIESLSNDKEWQIRKKVAEKGKQLDKLSNDEQAEVRGEVALQGHNLEKLENDESSWVRARVARRGHNLEKFASDESHKVRSEVAINGHKLDELVNDENAEVRRMVALKGHGLNQLKNDEDKGVRTAVEYSMNPELYNNPTRSESFSTRRKFVESVKGVEPVDYKEYAEKHNVSIPEAAKMRMKENLEVVNGENGEIEVEFKDDKPVFYKSSGGVREKIRADKDGMIKNAAQVIGGKRANRLALQYREALKTK